MRLTFFTGFLCLATLITAQHVDIIVPTPGTNVPAGDTFTATVRLGDTQSSLKVVALLFGLQPGFDPTENLLGSELTTIYAPTFGSGPLGRLTLDVPLTIPEGFTGLWNLTCGEFHTVGAQNIPSIFISKVPIQISSSSTVY